MIKFWITGHCKAEQKVKGGDTAGRAGSSCWSKTDLAVLCVTSTTMKGIVCAMKTCFTIVH